MAATKVPKSKRQYVGNLNGSARLFTAKLPDAKAGPMPRFVEPSLASLHDRIPVSGDWLHEIKYDGYRLQLHKKENDISFYTRRGYDWTDRFEDLSTAAWFLKCDRCVLDGEVIVPSSDGLSDFGALESDLGKRRSDRLLFFVFDVLYFEGYDLRSCRFGDRRTVIEKLLADTKGPIRLSEGIESVPNVFKQACKLGLEGIVSKKRDGRYRSGRTNNWTKVTCRKRDTFVVAGIAYKGKKFDGIYLGRKKGKSLEYAGKVEHGFSAASERDLRDRAASLVAPTQPLTKKIKKPKATWLKPKLLVDVEYRALTGDGKLRHPSFKGVREDL